MSPADRLVRNGTLAHRMAQLFVAAGLRDVHVEAATLVVRDPTDVDGVLGLRDWPAHGAEPMGTGSVPGRAPRPPAARSSTP